MISETPEFPTKRVALWRTTFAVSLGGFLLGFDASVISGAIGPIADEFSLSDLQLGWVVACLTLSGAIGIAISGVASDRYGRRKVLFVAALTYAVSAIWSAFAASYESLVLARMLGGLGVGLSLIVAPMYISEIAPADQRGRLVSVNQLNIVLGISVAFFSNYFLNELAVAPDGTLAGMVTETNVWRWMLGVEALPAIFYFVALLSVPESARWLATLGRSDQALECLQMFRTESEASEELSAIESALSKESEQRLASFRDLLDPKFRYVLLVGLMVALLQQADGINAVLFYAPLLFEQAGSGTDTSLLQAILVGLVNLVFTVVAILLIDRAGRRRLLLVGVAGVVIFHLLLAYGFNEARYSLSESDVSSLTLDASLTTVVGQEFQSESSFRKAVEVELALTGEADRTGEIVSAAIKVNTFLILGAVLGFVACHAMSLAPVMWVLSSELFPTFVRALAISVVGLGSSVISFLVQLLFPWQLATTGSVLTFLFYASVSAIGLVLIARFLPETKGKSLEEIERRFVISGKSRVTQVTDE